MFPTKFRKRLGNILCRLFIILKILNNLLSAFWNIQHHNYRLKCKTTIKIRIVKFGEKKRWSEKSIMFPIFLMNGKLTLQYCDFSIFWIIWIKIDDNYAWDIFFRRTDLPKSFYKNLTMNFEIIGLSWFVCPINFNSLERTSNISALLIFLYFCIWNIQSMHGVCLNINYFSIIISCPWNG